VVAVSSKKKEIYARERKAADTDVLHNFM